MKFVPSVEEIKKDKEFLKGKGGFINFISEDLDNGWTFYYRPHLNGLSPDGILLNPELGIQIINFYDHDDPFNNADRKYHLGSRTLDSQIKRLENTRKKIADLYSPRIRKFLSEEFPHFGSAIPQISLSLVAPKLNTKEIEAEMKEHGLWQEHDQRIRKNYFLAISNDVIKSKNINAAIPPLNLKGKSSIMKPEFANDLKIFLQYPDERREQFRKIKLSPIQERLATTRTERGLRRIKGAAGSGKSQVLISRACNLSLEGKRVLILSFNITLYQYLFSLLMRSEHTKNDLEIIRNIEIKHYHDWAFEDIWEPMIGNRDLWAIAEYEAKKNYKIDKTKTKAEHKFEAFDQQLLSELGDKKFELYDAILIDEGQDWDLDKWNVVRKTIKKHGELLLVADQTQDVYGNWVWTEEAMEGAGFSGNWNILEGSYRLPQDFIRPVQEFAREFIDDSISTLPEPIQSELPLGVCHMDWKQLPDYEDTTNKCVEVISSTLPNMMKEFSPADITFLAIDNDSGLKVVNGLEEKKINVLHTYGDYALLENHKRNLLSFEQERNYKKIKKAKESYKNKQNKIQRGQKFCFHLYDKDLTYEINAKAFISPSLKASTIHSFKGWESPALIIQIYREIDQPADEKYIAGIYTALTRLREGYKGASYIYVICSDPLFNEYQKKWNR